MSRVARARAAARRDDDGERHGGVPGNAEKTPGGISHVRESGAGCVDEDATRARVVIAISID